MSTTNNSPAPVVSQQATVEQAARVVRVAALTELLYGVAMGDPQPDVPEGASTPHVMALAVDRWLAAAGLLSPRTITPEQREAEVARIIEENALVPPSDALEAARALRRAGLSLPRREAEAGARLGGVGWYEVIHPASATTHVAYVYEDGSIYFPEGDQVLDRNEFALAAARGRAHRLVRADEVSR